MPTSFRPQPASAFASERPLGLAPATATTAAASPLALSCPAIIDERQQPKMPRSLDRLGERTLMLRADSATTTGFDLPEVGNELSQERDILIVDMHDAGFAYWINLPARKTSSSSSSTHFSFYLSLPTGLTISPVDTIARTGHRPDRLQTYPGQPAFPGRHIHCRPAAYRPALE